MTTAQNVFDIAMGFMDEVDSEGRTDTADTEEYKNRTLLILTALRGELYPYSDTYETDTEGRPIAAVIKDFEHPIGLDDYICQTVMPYGLAAHLLLDENPSAAGFYQQRYEELLRNLTRGMPKASEDIEDVYGNRGGIDPYNEFSMWS